MNTQATPNSPIVVSRSYYADRAVALTEGRRADSYTRAAMPSRRPYANSNPQFHEQAYEPSRSQMMAAFLRMKIVVKKEAHGAKEN